MNYNKQAQANKQRIICLMGPTASGKSDLALKLCDEFPCEIISVDSAMIYRGMDIGTAKPDAATLQRYPHHLVDILDPKESYSVGSFKADVEQLIQDIWQRQHIPLLVGGTMMYYRILQFGIATLPSANPTIRARLLEQAQQQGWAKMHERLQQVDPAAAARIHPNDPQRIQRALEVYEATGQSLSSLHADNDISISSDRFINIAIAPEDRQILHERIAHRFKLMLEMGFITEVEALYQRGDLSLSMPSIRCVGYRQVWQYLDGESDYNSMVDKGIIATRQLAKRQLTWLRKWPALTWFNSEDRLLNHCIIKELNSKISIL